MITKAKVVCLRPEKDFERANMSIPESFDIHFFPKYNEEEIARACIDADFLLAPSPRPPITAKIISQGKSLKLIQLCGSGYDTVDLDAADKARIPVANSPGQNARTVAEFAFTLINVLSRAILESDQEIKKGNYQGVKDRLRGEAIYELENRILGILGMGHIGKEMARIGAFFGTKTYYYDIRRLSPEEEKNLKATYLSLEDLFRISDFLSLHVPMTNVTKKLLGRKELALMKPSALLINTARGGVVDDHALLDALKANQLKGVALDVFDPEPIPSDHPFLSLDADLQKRVILTSHLAGVTVQSRNRMFREAIQNILRVMREERPEYVANLKTLQ